MTTCRNRRGPELSWPRRYSRRRARSHPASERSRRESRRRCPTEAMPISLRSSPVRLGSTFGVDIIAAERLGRLLEPQTAQPRFDIHPRLSPIGSPPHWLRLSSAKSRRDASESSRRGLAFTVRIPSNGLMVIPAERFRRDRPLATDTRAERRLAAVVAADCPRPRRSPG